MTRIDRLSRALAAAMACASPGYASADQDIEPTLGFVAETAADEAARAEYVRIWREDGARIIGAMQRISGIDFQEDSIGVIVAEGVSFSGFGARPMRLRSSYPMDTKRATLIHELGHRLHGRYFGADDEDHPFLFLYLYDVWVDLYGSEFAEEQVRVESRRRGLYDYESAWADALRLTREQRAARLREALERRRPDRGRSREAPSADGGHVMCSVEPYCTRLALSASARDASFSHDVL